MLHAPSLNLAAFEAYKKQGAEKMKTLSILTILAFAVGGCVHYAAIDEVHTGMTIEELMQVNTPCYYRGTKDQKVCYGCQFRIFSGGSVKPYILTFKDNIPVTQRPPWTGSTPG